jgi:cell wall-associated NlpC family hydrolase
MGSFVYSPQIRVYIEAGGSYYRKDTSVKTYDVSEDLVSGTMNRRLDGVSDFSFELLNPQRKYDEIFTPNDRITVLMKRVTWVRVFTGYLTEVPLLTAWPRNVSITASCSLKRLQYSYWDPESAYTQQMIMNALSASTGSGMSTDGGMTNVVLSVLDKVIGWPSSKVHIAKIPDDWFNIAQKIAASVEKSSEESDALAKQFFSTLGGNGTVGSSGGTTTSGAGDASGVLGSSFDEFGATGCRNAEAIFAAGSALNATQSDQIVGLMTAMQESHLGEDPHTNIPNQYGAVGVFQQIYTLPEWGGSLQSCLDVTASATRFFQHLFSMVPNRTTMPKGQQVNIVQRAGADQTANFQKWEAKATAMVTKIMAGVQSKATPSTPLTGTAPGTTTSTGTATNLQFIQGAKDLVTQYPSIPYTEKYGGTQIAVLTATPPPGLDCSSFVQAVVLRVLGGLYDFNAARVVADQRTICRIITADVAMKTPGALLFRGSDHVEISIGDGQHSIGAHHTGTFASVQSTTASYWTDGGLVPRINYGALGTGDGSTTGGTTGTSGATGAAQDTYFTDPYSSLPGYDPNDPFDRLFGDTAWQPLVSQQTSEAYVLAQTLTGPKALLNDQPLLPYIKNLFGSSMRSFCSAPNGDLIAWFPDYYGLWGTAAVMTIETIEVKDFSVSWSDAFFVTHQFTATTPSGGAGQNGLDLSTGNVTPLVDSVVDPLIIAQSLSYTRGIASIDIPAMMYALFKVDATEADAQAFAQWIYKRFGARPDFQQLPNLVGPSAEFFAAIYFFMRQWAYQYNADIPLTFMPELFPGMLIQIPDFSFQAYVNSVTHSFQFGQGGFFNTSVNISAPARLNDTGNGADVLIGLPSAGDFMRSS